MKKNNLELGNKKKTSFTNTSKMNEKIDIHFTKECSLTLDLEEHIAPSNIDSNTAKNELNSLAERQNSELFTLFLKYGFLN